MDSFVSALAALDTTVQPTPPPREADAEGTPLPPTASYKARAWISDLVEEAVEEAFRIKPFTKDLQVPRFLDFSHAFQDEAGILKSSSEFFHVSSFMETLLEVTRHVELRRLAGVAFTTFQLLKGESPVPVEQVMEMLPTGTMASADTVRNLLPELVTAEEAK